MLHCHSSSSFLTMSRLKKNNAAITNPASVQLPIDGTLDLHTFQPDDVADVVPEYLAACLEHDILQVRIVHGKGIGILRRTVESILRRLSYVESFRTAEENAGGWGATIVTLRRT
jgi:DNA-nicking Smr family endonuclease